jgi:hypothetical protein
VNREIQMNFLMGCSHFLAADFAGQPYEYSRSSFVSAFNRR